MLLLLHIIMTYIKENIIAKLQKLYSPSRSPRAGSKLPMLFVKKPLCTGDLSLACKIFIERPALPPARSTYYGTNSVYFRGPLIWNNLPSYIKSSRSVCELKNNMKNFRNIDCGCLICQIWIELCYHMHSFLLLLLFLFSLLLYSEVGFY